ncbi:MAG: serine/threonine protein kinase [Verrucomicrobiales bacterium]|jgi:serine/threonine protein kinase
MGAVYKAFQTKLKRNVAIKLLPPEMAKIDPSFAQRFQREAESMAALDHPNIVHVYDFGETEAGHSYFIMEFVDGMDMHQLIHRGQLDAKGALNAVSQICDALEYAHDQGFVHRDIKPANIFINQRGVLKVGDFGLAKIVGESSTTETGTLLEPLLTQPGMAMGTPVYSAPEQMDGRVVDRRADIYSLGVMFYEMLTGDLPQGAFQPPSQKVQVDVRLDHVVLKAMATEPERRYPSATEMRTEVDEVRTCVDLKCAGSSALSSAEPQKRTRSGASEAGPRKNGIRQTHRVAPFAIMRAIKAELSLGTARFSGIFPLSKAAASSIGCRRYRSSGAERIITEARQTRIQKWPIIGLGTPRITW